MGKLGQGLCTQSTHSVGSSSGQWVLVLPGMDLPLETSSRLGAASWEG